MFVGSDVLDPTISLLFPTLLVVVYFFIRFGLANLQNERAPGGGYSYGLGLCPTGTEAPFGHGYTIGKGEMTVRTSSSSHFFRRFNFILSSGRLSEVWKSRREAVSTTPIGHIFLTCVFSRALCFLAALRTLELTYRNHETRSHTKSDCAPGSI
jgi:hypothetical protein